jgi:tRNA (uracil-5-)-methyltransferase
MFKWMKFAYKHRKLRMSGVIQAGQIRSKPCSVDDSLQPAEKKPRIEPSSESTGIVTQNQENPSRKQKRRSKHRRILPEPCSVEDVLWRDVVSVLGKDIVDQALQDGSEWDSPFECKAEVELVVSILSSNGTSFHGEMKLF